jgi:hypothetical protein
MLNPNRVGMPFSRFGVKCMIARPDPLVPRNLVAWGQVLHSCNSPFIIVHDPIFGLNLQ